jgi:hypothetical protein
MKGQGGQKGGGGRKVEDESIELSNAADLEEHFTPYKIIF